MRWARHRCSRSISWGGRATRLPFELLGEVIRGGADVARAAGAFVWGGHSVDGRRAKYGMAAIGEVHPDRIVTNAGGATRRCAVLTKPLGTGVLTTALKRDLLTEGRPGAAVTAMTTLNAGAARAMARRRGCTRRPRDRLRPAGHLRTLL